MKEYYHASNYCEWCPACDNEIDYQAISGDKILTDEDYKPFNCPICGAQLLPCDLCHDKESDGRPCDNCPFET